MKNTFIHKFEHICTFLHSFSYWLCSHGLESRSERCFGSRPKTWLGSWFELRAFTCIANAFPITIRICALRGNILFLQNPRWLTHAWLQHGFSAHFQNAHAWITFRKSFAFICPRISLSRRITIQNALFSRSKRISKAWFETALRSHGLKSGLQIRKGSNHVLKRLSERDSSPCEHSHSWTFFCWVLSVLIYKLIQFMLEKPAGLLHNEETHRDMVCMDVLHTKH